MTQPVSTQELPERDPGRAVRIAAIHALAEWFAAHPEVPAPHTVTASFDVPDLVELVELGEAFGGSPSPADEPRMVTFYPICQLNPLYMPVTGVLFRGPDRRPL